MADSVSGLNVVASLRCEDGEHPILAALAVALALVMAQDACSIPGE